MLLNDSLVLLSLCFRSSFVSEVQLPFGVFSVDLDLHGKERAGCYSDAKHLSCKIMTSYLPVCIHRFLFVLLFLLVFFWQCPLEVLHHTSSFVRTVFLVWWKLVSFQAHAKVGVGLWMLLDTLVYLLSHYIQSFISSCLCHTYSVHSFPKVNVNLPLCCSCLSWARTVHLCCPSSSSIGQTEASRPAPVYVLHE